ncbi:MAG TPA: carbonic anhydrase [Gallionellaceae bacterium]
MPEDHLLEGLRRFKEDYFPRYEEEYRKLVEDGQHPKTLFIGCSDSRVLPNLLLGSSPGEVFIVRNVGNIVPPFAPELGYHGTCASIEFAVLSLNVNDIVVCGHSHCGAIRALYNPPLAGSTHLAKWLELAQDATLPVTQSEEALRRTEQRSIILQLERLMGYPMVRERVEQGRLFLHGWHYTIEEGDVSVLDVPSGRFVPAGSTGQPGGMKI